MVLRNLIFVFLMLGVSSPVWALSSDSKQPLHLVADSAQINNNTGISVYTGNVKMSQGSMQLLGHIVTVYTKSNQIVKVISVGDKKHQAFYAEEQDNHEGPIKAWGNTITYDVASGIIDLQHHAKVTRPKEVFTGEFIEYNQQSQTVNARSSEGNKRRVQIIIQPKSESSASTLKK